MKALRRWRLCFAVLALLLSPGGLAPWLQLAHACPTLLPGAAHEEMAGMGDMPGMAMDMAMPAAHHGQPGAPGPHSDAPHSCTCIGACHLFVAVELPPLVVVPQPVVVAAGGSPFVPAAAPVLLRLTELHPPATAPPVFA